jgi:hypothetical protein
MAAARGMAGYGGPGCLRVTTDMATVLSSNTRLLARRTRDGFMLASARSRIDWTLVSAVRWYCLAAGTRDGWAPHDVDCLCLRIEHRIRGFVLASLNQRRPGSGALPKDRILERWRGPGLTDRGWSSRRVRRMHVPECDGSVSALGRRWAVPIMHDSRRRGSRTAGLGKGRRVLSPRATLGHPSRKGCKERPFRPGPRSSSRMSPRIPDGPEAIAHRWVDRKVPSIPSSDGRGVPRLVSCARAISPNLQLP